MLYGQEKLSNSCYYKDYHYEKLNPIGLLEKVQKLIDFDKAIIEKNNIIKEDKKAMQIFKSQID